MATSGIIDPDVVELWDDYETEQARDDSVQPHEDYQERPLDWIVDKLGIPRRTLEWSINRGYRKHKWDGTREPLVAILESLAEGNDTGVESATGTGKSFLAACVVLWFLACWRGARVFTFAPKEDQLREFMWAEIGKLWPKFKRHFPTAELTDLRIRMVKARPGDDDERPVWGALGYSVGVGAGEVIATKAAGMHAEHMLLVNEETQGMPAAVLAAQENTATAPHNVRLSIGNPDDTLDALHTFCTSDGVTHVRISALDHPNVVTDNASLVPGAVSRKAIIRRRRKYGIEHVLYQSRVRGVSPAQSTEAIIKLEWVKAAALRDPTPLRTGIRSIGADVANSEGGDLGCIARGDGAVLLEVIAAPCSNANEFGTALYREMRRDKVEPWYVGIDPVGVGAGAVNELDKLTRGSGAAVQQLNGAYNPKSSIQRAPDGSAMDWVIDANEFANLRAQMHWQLREDLRQGYIAGAAFADPDLQRELITARRKEAPGPVLVESKKDIKKRLGGASPNRADAVMYWNWVRPRHKKAKPREHQDIDRVETDKLPTPRGLTHQSAVAAVVGARGSSVAGRVRVPAYKTPRPAASSRR